MYPNNIFLDLTLYEIFIMIGIIFAIISFRICLEKRKVPFKMQVFLFVVALFTAVIGYLSAVGFQDLYNYIETKVYVPFSGATFLGGFIGGSLIFLLSYFIIGKKIFKYDVYRYLCPIIDSAFLSLIICHSMGRMGCFFLGCCHGIESEFGLYFPVLGKTVLPTQLYEAIFLLVLYIVSMILFFKKKTNISYIYLISYGVFRFIIEFIRGDDRGEFLSFLSPSQFTSIILIIVGIILIIYRNKILIKNDKYNIY